MGPVAPLRPCNAAMWSPVKERLHARLLHQTGRGAAHHGIGHMGTAIGGGARPGNEAVTRANQRLSVCKVPVTRARSHCTASGQWSMGHHSDSSTPSATICGLTAMSGCTPIMRRVCCTTSLNTGAATRPP
jgi:hypothetical protein